MELRHFRYFAAVAEHLNYSEAARRLHVAQPAISQSILDLEAELEARLLLRTKRSVALTAAGTIFLKEAKDILTRADEAVRLTRRAARGEVGTLRVAFLAAAVSLFLPTVVQEYRRKYPEVEVKLLHMNPDEQLAAFDEGRIDLGLSRSLPADRRAGFFERTIYVDRMMLAVPANHPLAKEKKLKLKQVAAEPFVQFHRAGAPCVFDEVIATCRRAGFSPRVAFESNLLSTVITLVESGIGVSLVPGCARALAHTSVAFLPLAEPSKKIPLCATWHRNVDLPPVAAFLEVLSDREIPIQKLMENPLGQ